ncbi:hypothetical protein AB3N58_10200 [Leptospira sp. WS60.C2]
MKIKEYIKQFEIRDQPEVYRFIESLEFISFKKVKNELIDKILELKKTNPGKMAIYLIKKEILGARFQYTSAEKLGYAMRELEKNFPKDFCISPTIASLKAERIKSILLLDDIICSGTRVTNFIDRTINKTIKSWVSKKYTNIFVLSYIGYSQGLDKVKKHSKSIPAENIIVCKEADNQNPINSGLFDELLKKYAHYTKKSKAALGYKNSRGYHIFEYGCPNNTPSILWSDGSKWKSLLPNQTIPKEISRLFGDSASREKSLSKIHSSGQEKIAIGILDLIEKKTKSEEKANGLIILSILNMNVKKRNINKYISIEQSEILRSLKKLQIAGLVKSNGKLTAIGKEVLNKYKAKDIITKYINDEVTDKISFPKFFRGFPAKI